MKNVSMRSGAALALLCAVMAMPLHASTVLKIPAVAAKDANFDGDHCVTSEFNVSTDVSASAHCQVSFPLNLPVGTAIHQITIEAGSLGTDPNPSISGHLDLHIDGSLWGEDSEFAVSASNFPVYPQTMTLPIMSVGKNNPDTFTMDNYLSYSVVVDLQGTGVVLKHITVVYN